MPDNAVLVSFAELAEILVKEKKIHEGLWGLFVRFGLRATNVNFESADGAVSLAPTAMIPLVEIGIQEFREPNNLTVDAAKVNPKPTRRAKTIRKTAKKK